ncbi:MAG: molybdenum cofactor guanylyltransferase MobA [Rhodoferax sp.]|nr:molybdenum cofactor guanylyltransferase MobA [Rhodoferax sp.]MCF8208446.1 molybdenum cofactor guanylyltransferase MobA [Rhodoferax sp.]
MTSSLPPFSVTGVILAGGRGTRMGGVDKGLQMFKGQPLARWTLERLRPQVSSIMINANRNLEIYRTYDVPTHADDPDLGDFAGPLAGFLTSLRLCQTPYLVTVPCDTPLFPADLVARMAHALQQEDAEIVVASATEEDGGLRAQPVFCLLQRQLHDSLQRFMQAGGRKIDAWTAQHATAHVRFDLPGDDPKAFFNANTLAELLQLEANPEPHLAPTTDENT